MKFKIYTREPIQENDGVSKAEYIRNFILTNHKKLLSLEYLIEFINNHRYTNVLSLGSGQCVIEHMLSYSIPTGSHVVATDIDPVCLKNSGEHFKNIITIGFDFNTDTIDRISETTGIKFEVAYFMGSAYVMTDEQYVCMLRQLKINGVKHIIDFQPAFVPYLKLPITILGELKNRVFKSYRGRFHGYERTRGHLRQIYKRAGLTIEEEPYIPTYNNYIAVLR
jgi:hypothetical protein